MLVEENLLIQRADVVIASAARLQEELSKQRNDIALIRNGGEIEYFSRPPTQIAWKKTRPVVGYYGAIAEWFDMVLLVESAKAYPEWDFVLVGAVTDCDLTEAKKTENIHFVGEVPYGILTEYSGAFDVCLIPFKIIELTLCSNPVKVYEYLAAGKPVVSTGLPEVRLLSEYVYVEDTNSAFVESIASAMADAESGNREKVLRQGAETRCCGT